MIFRTEFDIRRTRSKQMFQGLKVGIVHFSNMNTLGDMAKIEFVFFIILCSNLVISYKDAKIGKRKFSHFKPYYKNYLS